MHPDDTLTAVAVAQSGVVRDSRPSSFYMESAMNRQIKGLVASLGALGVSLLLSGPAWSQAVQASAGAKPSAIPDTVTLEELDTIVINARRFEDRLAESERNFYRRYNQLNAKEDLDVNCDVWLADPNFRGAGPAPEKRHCLPKFLADRIKLDSPMVVATSRSGRGSFGRGPVNGIALGGGEYMVPNYVGYAPTYTPFNWSNSANASYSSSRSQTITPLQYLLYVNRRSEVQENLNTVMRSDPELQVLAGRFETLVQERDDTRRIAAEARKLRVAMRLEQRKCPQPTSPRELTKACKSS